MMTESRITRWFALWRRWGIALTLALLGVVGATAEIGFAQTCIQKEYYNFSAPYVLDISNGGKWEGTEALIKSSGLGTRQGRVLKFSGYSVDNTSRRDTAIINNIDFTGYAEGRLAFRYRSNVIFQVYCGSATNKLTLLTAIPARTSPTAGVSRTLTLTPAKCGISGTTLGKFVVKIVGASMNKTTKYIYLDNVSLATCPKLSFADPTTGEDLESINIAPGSSKEVKICLYGTDESGDRIETIPAGKTALINLISSNSSVVSFTAASADSLKIPSGASCATDTVTLTRSTDTATVTMTAETTSSSGIQYFDGSLLVSVSGLRFADTSGNTIESISSLNEKTQDSTSIKVCLPVGMTAATDTEVYLFESGDIGDIATNAADKDRVTTVPSTGLVNELTGDSEPEGMILIRAGNNCSTDNITISVKNDSITNDYSSVTLRAEKGTDTAELDIPLIDDEAPVGEWSWELREPMVLTPGGSVSAAIITAGGLRWQVFNDPSKCSAEPGYNSGDYAGCELACPYIAQPPATSANTQSIIYTSDPPAEVPFNITSPKPIPDDKVNKKVCVCVKNQDDASTTGTKCKSIPTIKAGAQFFLPTFLMTASYDWTHNFYDNNMEADTTVDGSYSDQDTDNFNKIVLVDSNLFPIYTALNGDQEFPNIVMRNWTGGVGVRSPSVNDYINRSVVAVGNYLSDTNYLYYGYGSTKAAQAVGMRNYMEWVYALDPANNNFRRYKFVKLTDDVIPPLAQDGGLFGNVEMLDPTDTTSDFSCTTCDACHWYQGTASQIFCPSSGGSSKSACCGTFTNTALACSLDLPSGADKDDIWAFSPKKPGATCGGSSANQTASYPSCNDLLGSGSVKFGPMVAAAKDKLLASTDPEAKGAPALRYPMLVSIKDIKDAGAGTVRAKFYFEANQFSSVAGLAFILGRGTSCEQTWVVSSNGNFDGKWQPKTVSDNLWDPSNIIFDPAAPTGRGSGPSPGSFSPGGGGSVKCEECRARAYVYFDVPTSCFNTMLAGSSEYKYLMVDIFTCDQASWAIHVPKIPQNAKDQAFRIPIPGVDDTTVTPPTKGTAEYQKFVERRWGNIGAYLNTVPPESYAGYRNYTSVRQRPGYGSRTQGYFQNATGVRFKDPRDIDAYRDYFDVKNGGPVYIFVADTGNNRIQVFMNATGAAGDVGATAPIRPVRVNVSVGGTAKAAAADTNEIGWRRSNAIFGDGRRGDWRGEMTQNGSGKWEDEFKGKTYGAGEFYYPHGVAVDQDPDSKDIYLFVADTFNHRIQVFRDVSGVSSQAITAKNFHFEFVTQFGTYPLQTGVTKTAPGPFALRYPKGLDIVRFYNNSSYLYVVDSKNYRLMKYQIGENPAAANGSSTGITEVKVAAGYGHDGSAFSKNVDSATTTAKARVINEENPGFLDPQDVATGYSGFFLYSSPVGKGTQFLNNYMIYVTDAARNNTTLNPKRVSARVLQMIDVPSAFSSISGVPIRWETARKSVFSTHTSRIWRRTDSTTTFPFNLTLGQSPFGLKLGRAAFELYSSGVYHSRGKFKPTAGSSSNVPGRTVGTGETAYSYFTDRPFGLNALHWNTLKPIDIRLIEYKSTYSATDIAYVPGDKVDLSKSLRLGVASRYMSFGQPYNRALSFLNASSVMTELGGPWDAAFAGRVHLFCYDKAGAFKNYTMLYPDRYSERYKTPATPLKYRPSYLVTLPTSNCVSGGFLKVVAEDKDFAYSARSGTAFYSIK